MKILDKEIITDVYKNMRSLVRNRHYVLPFYKRIGYIGWLGFSNIGDEAIYTAFKRLFSDFNVLPYKYTNKMNNTEKMFKIKFYNAVFLGGGTLINADTVQKEFELAQKQCDSTFVFGAGVRNPEYWTQLKGQRNLLDEWIGYLKKCKYVGVRGPLSKKILEQNGFDKADIIGDLALSLADSKIKPKERKRKIGINIGVSHGNIWGNEEEVLNFIVKFSRIMVDKGWSISFLPAWNRDIEYIEEATKRINKSVSICYDYLSLKKTMDFLRNCDLFIGEKLHSVVLSMCTNTPSIMLEYRPKCLDFMMSMGLEEFNIRTDKLFLEQLISLVDKLYSNLGYWQDNINRKVTHFTKIQKEKSAILTDMMLN